jgi:hypothetical protein
MLALAAIKDRNERSTRAKNRQEGLIISVSRQKLVSHR